MNLCKHFFSLGDLALCQTAADIGFIVDSSGSIGNQQYLNMKNFMKGITVAMGFKPSVTHIGIVLYSNRAELYTTFGEHANLRKLFRTLLKMPHHKDVTRIDLGLHIADTKLFTTDSGMREDVKKVAILFTDGEQTTVGVNDLIPLEQAAGRLKERGIDIFAVGIGKKVKRQQLLKIASSAEYVIMLRSFAELQESVSKIAAFTCQQVVGKSFVMSLCNIIALHLKDYLTNC